MALTPIGQKFVMHFGEMGGRWGINRTASRVFALLYLMGRPMHATEIVDDLGISRSNVSAALKDLGGWRLVTLCHIQGDRREHFTASGNVWEIARTLLEERRRREFEPTLMTLGEILEIKPASAEEREMHERIRDMHGLMQTLDKWYEDVQRLEIKKLVRLLKVGSSIYSMYAKASRRQPRLKGKGKLKS